MPKGIRIPSHPGDKGEYYLIDVKSDGNYFRTIHKRIGVDATGYSVTKIDCTNKLYQDLAYEESLDNIARIYSDTKWTEIVEGSSKWYLMEYVCKTYCK